jgi:hypothetical protein
MTKVIRLTESQLRKIVEKVIAEQSRSGTDPAVLQAIADMSFTKEACRKNSESNKLLTPLILRQMQIDKWDGDVPNKISAPDLVHEFCNTTYPNIEISYTTDGLELLDLKKQKIIKVWEGFSEKDIPELKKYVKMSTI